MCLRSFLVMKSSARLPVRMTSTRRTHTTEVGKNVKDIKVGDRVGVGAQVGSCMHCYPCTHDNENCMYLSHDTCSHDRLYRGWQGSHG